MEVLVGTLQDLRDSLYPVDVNGDDLTEDETYIFHIYNTGEIEAYPSSSDGTPIVFVDSEEPSDNGVDGSEVDDFQEEVIPRSNYVLPPLYAFDKNGKERIWKTWTVDNTVHKAYGEVGGALIKHKRSFTGVNVGDKDETTPEEQAIRQAERDWIAQLGKKYYPKSEEGVVLADKIMKARRKQNGVNTGLDALIRDRVDAPEGEEEEVEGEEVDDTDYGDIMPMHAQTWLWENKCFKYFDFDSGVYIQPKLDGVRCIAQIRGNKVALLTKTGKDMVWLNHLREEIMVFLSEYPDVLLDGEIYAHSIRGMSSYKETGGKKKYTYSYDWDDDDNNVELDEDQRFDVISGSARPKRNEPHPLEDQLCLHVFDIADPTGELNQNDRFETLKTLFSSPLAKQCPHIKLVETKVIYFQEEITEYHDEMSELGYEGVVMRAQDLLYEFKNRSLRMRKYKYFIDEEYPIVDVKCDEGVDRGNFVWVCEKESTDENGQPVLKTFKAKPKGTQEMRWNWYDNYEEYIGKLLKVRFQRYTYDDVPLFPRGISIRDYE